MCMLKCIKIIYLDVVVGLYMHEIIYLLIYGIQNKWFMSKVSWSIHGGFIGVLGLWCFELLTASRNQKSNMIIVWIWIISHLLWATIILAVEPKLLNTQRVQYITLLEFSPILKDQGLKKVSCWLEEKLALLKNSLIFQYQIRYSA